MSHGACGPSKQVTLSRWFALPETSSRRPRAPIRSALAMGIRPNMAPGGIPQTEVAPRGLASASDEH